MTTLISSHSPDAAAAVPSSPRGEPTWEIALLFPPQGEWTEEEYLALDTHRLVEFDNGLIEVLPVPSLYHQFIVAFLYDCLRDFIKETAGGRVVFAPSPVRLWPAKLREPDLFYLSQERIPDDRRIPPSGADLAMEILSPGAENRQRDLVVKHAEYAKAGIQEYWIVDPEERKILVYVLEGQSYRLHGEFGEGEAATSVLLPGFSASVSEVFAAGEK